MSQELRLPPTEIDLVAFISKEAHDLRSPFSRALGFLELVLNGMDGPISEQAQEDLTVAFHNILYILAMVSALVDIARLERGEHNPNIDAYPVDGILHSAASRWSRKYYKENSVEINISAAKTLIQADEKMIRQCFMHWISYLNEFVQGDVTINIQAEEQPEACLITIRSNGTKRSSPPECDLTLYGYVARAILDLHLGSLIQLEQDEQGSLVRFSLPKAQ